MSMNHLVGVHRALFVRQTNSLHGFNVFTDDGSLILGLLYYKGSEKELDNTTEKELDNTTLNAHIRGALKLNSDEYKSFDFVSSSYAGDILQVPGAIRHLAGVVIDTARHHSFAVKLQTKLGSWGCLYPPLSTLAAPFSKEMSEKLAAHELNTVLTLSVKLICQPIAWLLGDARLWCTEEGKTAAERIRQLFPAEVDSKTPLFMGDKFLEGKSCDYDFPVPVIADLKSNSGAVAPVANVIPSDVDVKSTVSAPSIPSVKSPVTSAIVKPSDVDVKSTVSAPSIPFNSVKYDAKSADKMADVEEPKKECSICFAADVETMVLPCMHHVVCRKCSTGLSNTPDAKICVQCRKPITAII